MTLDATYGWRFVRIDLLGRESLLTPDVSGTLTWDHVRDVRKTIDGLTFVPDHWQQFAPGSDVIRVELDRDGTVEPVGLFRVADATERPMTFDTSVEPVRLAAAGVPLADQTIRLRTATEQAIFAPAGADPAALIRQILDQVGLPNAVPATVQVLADPIGWTPGTTLIQIVSDLALLAGHYGPWQDNRGIVRTTPVEGTPDDVIPDLHDLGVQERSVGLSTPWLSAPNRVVVTDTSGPLPVVGAWDAPVAAPHSRVNRGFLLTEVVNQQGLTGPGHAAAVAATIGTQRFARQLAATIIPTAAIDGFRRVAYLGRIWRVIRYTIPLTAGGLLSLVAVEEGPVDVEGGVGGGGGLPPPPIPEDPCGANIGACYIAQINGLGGLEGWWRLNDLGPAVAADYGPGGFHGNWIGAAIFCQPPVTGPAGTSSTNPDDVAYAESAIPYLDPTDDFLVTAWIRPESPDWTHHQTLVEHNDGKGVNGWGLWLTRDGLNDAELDAALYRGPRFGIGTFLFSGQPGVPGDIELPEDEDHFIAGSWHHDLIIPAEDRASLWYAGRRSATSIVAPAAFELLPAPVSPLRVGGNPAGENTGGDEQEVAVHIISATDDDVKALADGCAEFGTHGYPQPRPYDTGVGPIDVLSSAPGSVRGFRAGDFIHWVCFDMVRRALGTGNPVQSVWTIPPGWLVHEIVTDLRVMGGAGVRMGALVASKTLTAADVNLGGILPPFGFDVTRDPVREDAWGLWYFAAYLPEAGQGDAGYVENSYLSEFSWADLLPATWTYAEPVPQLPDMCTSAVTFVGIPDLPSSPVDHATRNAGFYKQFSRGEDDLVALVGTYTRPGDPDDQHGWSADPLGKWRFSNGMLVQSDAPLGPPTDCATLPALGPYETALLALQPGGLGFWRLAEPSGGVACDETAASNDGAYAPGIIHGLPSLVVPAETGCVGLGTGGRMQAPFPAVTINSAPNPQWTVLVLCQPNSDDGMVWAQRNTTADLNGTSLDFTLQPDGQGSRFRLRRGSPEAVVATVAEQAPNRPHHLSAARSFALPPHAIDGVHLWLDGIDHGKTVVAGGTSTPVPVVFGDTLVGDRHLDGGIIDQARIVSSALSDVAIATKAAEAGRAATNPRPVRANVNTTIASLAAPAGAAAGDLLSVDITAYGLLSAAGAPPVVGVPAGWTTQWNATQSSNLGLVVSRHVWATKIAVPADLAGPFGFTVTYPPVLTLEQDDGATCVAYRNIDPVTPVNVGSLVTAANNTVGGVQNFQANVVLNPDETMSLGGGNARAGAFGDVPPMVRVNPTLHVVTGSFDSLQAHVLQAWSDAQYVSDHHLQLPAVAAGFTAHWYFRRCILNGP